MFAISRGIYIFDLSSLPSQANSGATHEWLDLSPSWTMPVNAAQWAFGTPCLFKTQGARPRVRCLLCTDGLLQTIDLPAFGRFTDDVLYSSDQVCRIIRHWAQIGLSYMFVLPNQTVGALSPFASVIFGSVSERGRLRLSQYQDATLYTGTLSNSVRKRGTHTWLSASIDEVSGRMLWLECANGANSNILQLYDFTKTCI